MPPTTDPPTPSQEAAGNESPRTRKSTVSSVRSAAVSVALTTRRAADSVGQVARDALNVDPPLGAWAAAAQATSHAPTLTEIRQGAFREDGWHEEEEKEVRQRKSSVEESRRRQSRDKRPSGVDRPLSAARISANETRNKPPPADENVAEPFPSLEVAEPIGAGHDQTDGSMGTSREGTGKSIYLTDVEAHSTEGTDAVNTSARDRAYSSGYVPPPHLPWTTSSWIGFKAFLRWASTPLGFLITIYSLNVVAWGGMLFLLLCNASQVMCWSPDGQGGLYLNCDDINSPRRIWLEVDSQILNALFCVTGFGLIPWRFRDLYYLIRWRLCSEKRYGRSEKMYGLRTLAGINRGWFRLPNSDTLDEVSSSQYLASQPASIRPKSHQNDLEDSGEMKYDPRLPVPLSKSPPPPLTGVRAPPTALWKLDFFIWSQVWNTLFQVCLCGFMWGMNRYDRPSWATGLFIALGCIIAGLGGLVSFMEGKRVKRVEGERASKAVEREIQKMLAQENDAELRHVSARKRLHGADVHLQTKEATFPA